MGEILNLLNFNSKIYEDKARILLKSMGYKIQNPDWLAKGNDGKYYCIEVKHKKKNKQGNSYYETSEGMKGHGLNYSQFKMRMDLLHDLKIHTILVIFDHGDKTIYYADLLDLAMLPITHKVYLPKSKVILFDINCFKRLEKNAECFNI